MYLREVYVCADKSIVERFPHRFVEWIHRESCWVTEIYHSLLRKTVATADTVKVCLEFVEHEPFVPTVRQLLSVADAKWFFRFSEYAERDEIGKKQMMLDAIHEALRWIAKERNWNEVGLEECYTAIIAGNLTFERWSKKSCLTPDRKHRIRLGFNFGLRTIDFFLGIFDRKGTEIGRKPLGSVVPEVGIVNEVLKSDGKWVRGRTFRLDVRRSCFYVPKRWDADLSDLLA